MASMRRAVRMSWAVSSRGGPARTGGPSWQPTASGAPLSGVAPRVPGAPTSRGAGGLGSADSQLAVADPGQGAFGAPALGPVDEGDHLAALDQGDGVPAGHGVLDVALPARARDEPHQVGLGREPLAVAGGVAEQEPGQLR